MPTEVKLDVVINEDGTFEGGTSYIFKTPGALYEGKNDLIISTSGLGKANFTKVEVNGAVVMVKFDKTRILEE